MLTGPAAKNYSMNNGDNKLGKERAQNRAAGCCKTQQIGLVVAHGLALLSVWMGMLDVEAPKKKMKGGWREF